MNPQRNITFDEEAQVGIYYRQLENYLNSIQSNLTADSFNRYYEAYKLLQAFKTKFSDIYLELQLEENKRIFNGK